MTRQNPQIVDPSWNGLSLDFACWNLNEIFDFSLQTLQTTYGSTLAQTWTLWHGPNPPYTPLNSSYYRWTVCCPSFDFGTVESLPESIWTTCYYYSVSSIAGLWRSSLEHHMADEKTCPTNLDQPYTDLKTKAPLFFCWPTGPSARTPSWPRLCLDHTLQRPIVVAAAAALPFRCLWQP